MWLASLLPPLFLTSIVTLALSGAETPTRIQTLTQTSWAEQEFARRCMKLQKIGFSAVGLALLLTAVVGFQFLR